MSAPAAHPPHESNGNGFKLEVGRRALPYVGAILVSSGVTFGATRVAQGETVPTVPAHVERSIEQLQQAREAHAQQIGLLQQQVGIELKGFREDLGEIRAAVQGLQDEPRFRRREGR